jgi:regulator of replication initiation timing
MEKKMSKSSALDKSPLPEILVSEIKIPIEEFKTAYLYLFTDDRRSFYQSLRKFLGELEEILDGKKELLEKYIKIRDETVSRTASQRSFSKLKSLFDSIIAADSSKEKASFLKERLDSFICETKEAKKWVAKKKDREEKNKGDLFIQKIKQDFSMSINYKQPDLNLKKALAMIDVFQKLCQELKVTSSSISEFKKRIKRIIGYKLCLKLEESKIEDNKLYVEKGKDKDGDFIKYFVIGIDEEIISDTISNAEFKKHTEQDIPEPMTIDSLQPFLPKILNILSKREHTLDEISSYQLILEFERLILELYSPLYAPEDECVRSFLKDFFEKNPISKISVVESSIFKEKNRLQTPKELMNREGLVQPSGPQITVEPK